MRQIPVILRENHYWCPWDAPTIVERCVVEDTEETKEHKRVLTPFSCWRLWACCTAATYSRHVPHNLGKSPQCCEGPVSFSNSLGTMESVCGRGIEETSGTNGNGVRHWPTWCINAEALLPAGLVGWRQGSSTSPAGSQPDTTYGSVSTPWQILRAFHITGNLWRLPMLRMTCNSFRISLFVVVALACEEGLCI